MALPLQKAHIRPGGRPAEGSDIDLLIETGPHRTPWFPGGLIADLEELLGCRVDVVTEKALHLYLRDRVLQRRDLYER